MTHGGQGGAGGWGGGVLTALGCRGRRLEGGPLASEVGQAIDATEVPGVGEGAVEGADCCRRDRHARVLEAEVRRRQQRDERDAGAAADGDVENEVERRGERFGGQRQRVEGLERHAGAAEDRPREVQVRQRPPHDERPSMQRRGVARPARRLDASRDGGEFLLAIARVVHARPLAIGHDESGTGRLDGDGRHFLEPGQRRVNPLEKAGREGRLGRHHVQACEARQRRQQREVNRPQPVGIAHAIADGEDDVAQGVRGLLGQQTGARAVLVEVTRVGETRLVAAEDGRQERGLPEQLGRAAIRVGGRLQFGPQVAVEVLDGARLAADVVVGATISATSAGRSAKGGSRPAAAVSRARRPMITSRSNGDSVRTGRGTRARSVR